MESSSKRRRVADDSKCEQSVATVQLSSMSVDDLKEMASKCDELYKQAAQFRETVRGALLHNAKTLHTIEDLDERFACLNQLLRDMQFTTFDVETADLAIKDCKGSVEFLQELSNRVFADVKPPLVQIEAFGDDEDGGLFYIERFVYDNDY